MHISRKTYRLKKEKSVDDIDLSLLWYNVSYIVKLPGMFKGDHDEIFISPFQ